MTFRRSLSLSMLIPLVLVACANAGTDDAGAGTDPGDLTGVEWRLDGSSIASLVSDAPADAVVTIEFTDGQAGGTAACNSYGGTYEANDDGSIAFDSFSVTEMACEESLMSLENAYLTALGQVTGFGVGDGLSLTGADVTLAFSAVPEPEPLALVGTNWTLTTIASGDTVSSTMAGTEITAVLTDDGSISGSAGCNRYSGSYIQGDGGALSFSPLASTKMMCADDVLAQESAFLDRMEQVAGFRIEGSQLQLVDGAGALLLGFEGTA